LYKKQLGVIMKKRKITDIMEEMDRVEKVVISDELIEILKEHFKEDIENEKKEKSEIEKVASGVDKNTWINNQGNKDNGQSDRV
jgi:flagellar biosynthesis regulator FlbT